MTAAEPDARTELEQVAVFALQAVMRGEVDEAAALVGQLTMEDRQDLHDHVHKLHRAVAGKMHELVSP